MSFQEVLDKESPEEPAVAQEADQDLDFSTWPPTKEEVIEAITNLKNGKAPGQDQLSVELLSVIQRLQQRYYSHSLLKYGM